MTQTSALKAHFIKTDLLSADQLKIIEEEQQHDHRPFDQLGWVLGFYSKRDCLKCKADFYQYPFVDFENQTLHQQAQWAPYQALIRAYHGRIYKKDTQSIAIALEDPIDITQQDAIRHIVRQYDRNIQSFEFAFGYFQQYQPEACTQEYDFISDLNTLIEEAILSNVSDIHLRPEESTFKMYFRVHGVLTLRKTWHKNYAHRAMNRLKIKAGLDIAQSRQAQSGRYMYTIHDRSIDLRISTHPTIFGERMAIRILDTYKVRHDLAKLGFSDINQKNLIKCLGHNQGMVLVSGATGSGKTTTLYACLDALKHRNLNIMTLEDPVECALDYACQMEISPLMGYADGIRSILRQDPDIILIGEIRDEETAQMAFRAAMTGHLVLSSIHVPNLKAIEPRLLDLGVSPYYISHFLLCALHQQLNPVIHQPCNGKGCDICQFTGIGGRELSLDMELLTQ
ncbi:MAG: ATPase, T2SS/T4P/T4SS family [Alphaproteobacteria bacterium]|nr:ATPase, T2SS/T4P/T4SS family [Alphaproteobacteria bacterium]